MGLILLDRELYRTDAKIANAGAAQMVRAKHRDSTAKEACARGCPVVVEKGCDTRFGEEGEEGEGEETHKGVCTH